MGKMRCGANLNYRGIAIFMAFTIAMLALWTLPVAPAHAQDAAEDKLATGVAAEQSDSELPVWAQDTGEKAGARLAIQSSVDDIKKFDLREPGDTFKTKIVTPVKAQSPFSTCWAFGAIAAAEMSIAADFGKENIDLSEKHLTWYGMHPLTKDDTDTQVGEGIHVFKEGEVLDASYISSNPVVVSSVFGSGVGPLSEEAFPYHGINSLSEYGFVTKHTDKWRAYREKVLRARYGDNLDSELRSHNFSSLDEYLDQEYEDVKKGYENGTTTNYYMPSFKDPQDESAYLEDWRIPALDEDGDSNRNTYEGYTLRDGNLMPSFTKTENGEVVPNQEGLQAVKQELLRGHGVACMFCADTSRPGQQEASKYINVTGDNPTWAHYTYEKVPANHGVCIVGWDDEYPASNFKEGHRPPGNGAWIVKNSWGCKDGCETIGAETIGKNNWGVNGSGYFYISYYDQTLARGESFTFSDDLNGDEFYPNQYDFMPATDWFLVLVGKNGNLLSSANVFTAEADQRITSVSTCSDEENARVTFAMYRLGPDAKNPTDGELVGKQSYDLKYAGYHRVDLNEPFFVGKGQRFSVVSSVVINGTYQVMASSAYGKDKAQNEEKDYYSEAVVNKGESYYFTNGAWVDWVDYKTTSEYGDLLSSASRVGDVVDNFPIKAFGVPAKVSAEEVAAAAAEAIDKAAAEGATAADVAAARAAYDALSDEARALLPGGALAKLEAAEAKVAAEKAAAEKAAAEKAAAAKAAAEKAAASNVNIATVTAAQAKKASNLGVTTITLGPKVKKIAKGVFAGTKIKTIVVKTKKLKKKSVKGALKGSSVKTVKVQIGSKKVNKKYVKKYQKIFKKKNSGKKVTVKA